MHIGELAQRTGLTRDTLRYYEKRKLLRSTRTENGYRHYPQAALEWLSYLKTAQSLGFSLAEIEADLPLLANPAASAPRVRAALARKLSQIDERISGLQQLRAELQTRLGEPMSDCPLRVPGAAAKRVNK